MSEEFDFDRYDDEAETEKALDEEQDERDAAASEPRDEHEDEREELHGNDLVWWHDTSLFDAYVAMGDLFEEVLMNVDRSNQLFDAGLDPGTMSVETVLTMKTGPLVLTALNLLGLYVPSLRSEITEYIKSLDFPVATEEENEAINAAIERVLSDQKERMESLLRKAANESTQAGHLGLDPN